MCICENESPTEQMASSQGTVRALTSARNSGSIRSAGAIGCCFVVQMDNLGEL